MKLTEEYRSTRRKKLSQCHFVHHQSHVDWPGIEHGPPRWEADDWLPEPWHGLRMFDSYRQFERGAPLNCTNRFVATVWHAHYVKSRLKCLSYWFPDFLFWSNLNIDLKSGSRGLFKGTSRELALRQNTRTHIIYHKGLPSLDSIRSLQRLTTVICVLSLRINMCVSRVEYWRHKYFRNRQALQWLRYRWIGCRIRKYLCLQYSTLDQSWWPWVDSQ
jgi:hypothetical protein